MLAGHVYYLPLSPLFFLILVGAAIALIVLIQIGALTYAYHRLGVSSGAAMLLLVGALIGSYINIPVYRLPDEQVLSAQGGAVLRHDVCGAAWCATRRERPLRSTSAAP